MVNMNKRIDCNQSEFTVHVSFCPLRDQQHMQGTDTTDFLIGEIMYINEQYQNLSLLEKRTYQYIGRDGKICREEEQVLNEHVMDIYVNDLLTMKLICLPQHLTELVLGRLLTEHIITSTESVEHIYICEHGKRAKVYLKDTATGNTSSTDSFVEVTPTCCTGNRILNDYFVSVKEPEALTPIHWEPEWIFHMADAFANGSPLHSVTFATHSCFLAREDQILFSCEDIGRHNALDKAIGYALRHNIDLHQCMIYSSGRIPTDMAMKTIQAGIPILSSKASPTSEAIELANRYHLTLVCAARKDRMKIYASPEFYTSLSDK